MHRSLGFGTKCRAVAERSVGLRSDLVMGRGGIGSANADMSSDKEGEMPSRRKTKGSCLKLI
jgi:hypothetical protein